MNLSKNNHKNIMIVGLYPHTVIYHFKLIEKLKREGYYITLSLRTKTFSVGSERFYIQDSIIYKSNSSSESEVFLSLNGFVDNLIITERHEIGLLYLIKYLIRPLRNVAAKSYSNDDVFYKKQRKNLSSLQKIILNFFYFSPKALNKLLLFVENLLPPSKLALKSLASASPDIVFVSPANWENRRGYLSSESEYVKAASVLNIPSITYQLSLDNFYAREIIHIKPSLLIAWVENSLKFVKELSLLDNKLKTAVCGSLYLEMRFSDLEISKLSDQIIEENYMIYLGSASGIVDANKEYEYFVQLRDFLEKNNIKLIYRSHPNNYPKKYVTQSTSFESGESLNKLYKSILSSKGVIGISTTLLFESYSLNVPVFFNNMTNYNLHSDLGMSSFSSECTILSSKEDFSLLLATLKTNKTKYQDKIQPSEFIYNQIEQLLLESNKYNL
jgi:hypothetical protein